jgi:hypothetical protein
MMSRDEQALAIERQAPSSAAANESLDAAPEEPLTRLQRIALPLAQRKVATRRTPGAAIAIARILAAIGAYSLPALALCIAIGAVGYSMWVAIDVAQSAGSLDFSRVEEAFGQIDFAARAFMACVAYILLVLSLYLLTAAVRAGETWAPLVVALFVTAPVVLLFTLSVDLAFSLAPADAFPAWTRAAIEAVALGHAIFLAVLLRGRRPIAQALNRLAFTRRHDAGILYEGELPRLHIIRFATGASPTASAAPPTLPPTLVDSPAVAIASAAAEASATPAAEEDDEPPHDAQPDANMPTDLGSGAEPAKP